MTVPTTITRKCTAESVQLHLPETTSFASLQQIIETTFAYPVSNKLTKYSITYQDDEGDCIRVETEPETREAFRFGASNGSLAIVVLEDNKPTCCSSSSPALPQALPQEQQAQEQEQQQEEQKSISTNDSSSNDGKVHVVVDLPTGGEYSCYVDADQPLDELKHIIMQQAGINMPSGVFELVRQEELTSKPTHNAMCDVCGSTIVGIRYKCLNCEDYDLCETCEESNFAQHHHTPSHAFAKLRRPIRWGYRHVCPNFYAQEPANTTTETNTTTTTTTDAADVDPLDRIEKDLVALRDQLNAEKAKREQHERDERQRKAEEQRKLMEAQQAKRREANRARQLRKQQQRQAREAERQQREAERKVREEVRKAEQEARKAEQEAIAEAVRKSAEEAKAKAEAEAKAKAEAEAKAQAEAEAKAKAEAEAEAKAEAEAQAQAEAEAQARLAAEQEFITPVDSLSLSEYGSFCFVTPDAPTSTPVVEEPVDEPQEQEQEQEEEQPQEQEQQETNVDGYADDETYMADSATFQYVEESMKQLEQMGFENYEQNLTLVIKHKGDMLKIISDLVN